MRSKVGIIWKINCYVRILLFGIIVKIFIFFFNLVSWSRFIHLQRKRILR